MKVAVIGSRNFQDQDLLEKTLADLPITMIVSGGAKGADTLAEAYADRKGLEKKIFKPEYDKYPPKVAPLMRNKTIVEKADAVVAFWDGSSKGTANAVDHARKLGKRLFIVHFTPSQGQTLNAWPNQQS